MSRKTYHMLLFCILFSVTILAACTKSSQVPEVVATTPVVPQDTEVVATPTILPTEPKAFAMPTDVWHLLILSESSMWGLGEAYAAQIEKDVGVKVVVEDYAVGGLTVGEALNALKQEEPIRWELHDLPTAISNADVIVMGHTGDPAVSLIPENKWDMDGCLYNNGLPPKQCNPAALEQYTTDLKWIWGEIFRLRNGQPTILRSLDVYNPWISIWNEKDIYLACNRCWENLSNAVHMAAEAYHIPFVHRYDAYNGVNHDEDPREKGYILSDGTHPTDLAQQVTAELLAKLGYDPVPPPTFSSQPMTAIDIQPIIDMLVQYDQKMTEWSSLMGTTHTFDTGDPTYQEYLYHMLVAAMNPYMVTQDSKLQMINNNLGEVNKITALGDSIISLSDDIEVGFGSLTVPQEQTVPRKQTVDCINANSEYFQLVNNFLNHGYIPTMNEYNQLWIPFPCLNYQDSISLLKQFVQDNQ